MIKNVRIFCAIVAVLLGGSGCAETQPPSSSVRDMKLAECQRIGGKEICAVEGADIFGLVIGMDADAIEQHLTPFWKRRSITDIYFYNNEIGVFLSSMRPPHNWPDISGYEGMMIDWEIGGREGILRYQLSGGRIVEMSWESDYIDF